MVIFKCPVCGKNLIENGSGLKCDAGHNFDRSRNGYYNLLMTNTGRHGDDRMMVRARSSFLDSGYYQPLLDGLSDNILNHLSSGILVDAGCGEGYYTGGISEKLKSAGIHAEIIAVDISKTAVDTAAKRRGAAAYAVASVYDLPLHDASADAILNIFAPFSIGEYKRILKEGGKIFCVIPLERHLFGLKKLIYDHPYINEVKPYQTSGLILTEEHDIKYSFVLHSNQDIMNLFMMTPYYYTTGEEDQNKIKNASFLETEAEFRILTYKRK